MAATAGIRLAVASIALRRLGAVDYGYIAIIVTVTSLLTVLDVGLGTMVVRATAQLNISRSDTKRRQLAQDIAVAHSAYFALGLVGGTVALLIALVAVLTDASDVNYAAALVTAGAALSIGSSACLGLATGHRHFRLVTLSVLAGLAINLALVGLLTTPLGIVAIGLGEFIGSAISRGALVVWVSRSVRWFRLRPMIPRYADFRRVVGVALPLLVVGVSGQIVNFVDLLVVGSVASVAAVGVYRLGSLLPAQAVGVLYQGYDVAIPSLAVQSGHEQERATNFLTRVASYVAGTGFLLMIVLRTDIVYALAGFHSRLGASVLAIFCLVWLCNATVHGLAVLLVVRDQLRLLTILITVEAVANLLLTIVLGRLLGPTGVAWATLITLGVSNVIVLPVLLRWRQGTSEWRIAIKGVNAAVLGAAVGCMAGVAATHLSDGVTRIGLGLGLAILLASPLGLLLLGHEGRQFLRTTLRASSPEQSPPALTVTS